METDARTGCASGLVNELRTSGIILRTRRLTESSLIVHWLTADHGRLATVAKGALRPKSAFRGKLDLFHEAELTLVRSRSSDLHTLKEISLRSTHAGLRRDLLALQQASYAAALIERITETDAPTPELHELLTGLVTALAQSGASDTAVGCWCGGAHARATAPGHRPCGTFAGVSLRSRSGPARAGVFR